MKEQTAKVIEGRLKGLSYPEIEKALGNVIPQMLVQLLDSKSIKVGDSAAGILTREQVHSLVIPAILEREITTKLGKLRATNILFSLGRQYPEAMTAYLALLEDKNDGAARNVLLALVMWRDVRVIPLIKARQAKVKSVKDAEAFQRACEAIEKSEPSIFSPYFSDDSGIWK
jgi:hypothetical protein